MIKHFYFYQFNLAKVDWVKWFQVLPCITSNSIKHQAFVYIQLNDKIVLFLTIQFCRSHLFAEFKCQTVLFDPIRCYHFRSKWTWERWQWRGTPHFPKLQHYWSLTILFDIISRTRFGKGGSCPSAEMQSVYSRAPANWAEKSINWFVYLMWRCPWCNGYRRRKWTWWHKFKSWMRLIAFHIALILLGKVWIQLFSLQIWVNSRTDWVL